MRNAMRNFREALLRYRDHICKIAFLRGLEVEDGENWEFTLVAKWNGGEHRKKFTREYVMGHNTHSPRMRTCRFRDDFIRDVLASRGI